MFDKTLTPDQLFERNAVFNKSGMRPDAQQNLVHLRKFIGQIASGKHPDYQLGSKQSIIAVGIDSLNYGFAKNNLTPDDLYCVSTIFPSTSSCCWIASITGKGPEESGVSGVVFYSEELESMYITHLDKVQQGKEWVAHPESDAKLPIGNWDSVFLDLNAMGYKTVCLDGFFAYKITRWSQGLHRHAQHVVKSSGAWLDILMGCDEMVDSLEKDLKDGIKRFVTGEPVFMWNLFNFDRYIHHRGFTDELGSAVRRMDSMFHEMAQQGHLVIVYADHGQTPHISVHSQGEEWDALHDSPQHRLPFGGAGRVRWSYPVAGHEDRVARELQDLVGENGVVVHRDELHKHGICNIGPRMQSQMGEIITLATGAQFPTADFKNTVIYEHGSITRDEMLVPVAVYRAAV